MADLRGLVCERTGLVEGFWSNYRTIRTRCMINYQTDELDILVVLDVSYGAPPGGKRRPRGRCKCTTAEKRGSKPTDAGKMLYTTVSGRLDLCLVWLYKEEYDTPRSQ